MPTHVRRRWPRVSLGEGSVGAVPTTTAVCSADFTASLHAAASVVAAVAIAALASGHAAPTHAAATNVALSASTAPTELAAAPLATFDGHVPSLVGHLLRRDQWHRRQRRRQRRRRNAELLHPLRRRVQLRDSHVRRATRRGDGRGGGAGAGAGAEPTAIARADTDADADACTDRDAVAVVLASPTAAPAPIRGLAHGARLRRELRQHGVDPVDGRRAGAAQRRDGDGQRERLDAAHGEGRGSLAARSRRRRW